jgi:chaperonin GroEL
MRSTLSQPMKQIAINSGLDGNKVLKETLKHDGNYGYNAATLEYGDLFEQKIIDPTKVVRIALQNAVSIASLMLSTECLIINNRQYMPKTGNMI